MKRREALKMLLAGLASPLADTENHVIRAIDLQTNVIRTVLGTGQRGDGPEPDPMRCALSRPHGVLVDRRGVLYVSDSEAHRIRVVRGHPPSGGPREIRLKPDAPYYIGR
jgi:hypothetical protein